MKSAFININSLWYYNSMKKILFIVQILWFQNSYTILNLLIAELKKQLQ